MGYGASIKLSCLCYVIPASDPSFPFSLHKFSIHISNHFLCGIFRSGSESNVWVARYGVTLELLYRIITVGA